MEGDLPETLYCALMHVMDSTYNCAGQGSNTSIGTWRPIDGKFIVYLTDAPALSPEPFTGNSAFTVYNEAISGGFELFGGEGEPEEVLTPHGISIYPIVIGGNPVAIEQANELAVATGGQVFYAPTAADVVGAIIDAITHIISEPVQIDIKPKSTSNSINVNRQSTVSVGILSTTEFDASTQLDIPTITFGHSGVEQSLHINPSIGKFYCYPTDANTDELTDLVCLFDTATTGFGCDSTEGILRGSTMDGRNVEGRDLVTITPCSLP